MKVRLLLLTLLFFDYVVAQDLCINAVSLSTSSIICGSTSTTINFGPVIPTTSPSNTCDPLFPPDFWLHLNVPIGSPNSYMIRRRADTNIQARAEVLYKFGCAPAGSCCQSGMTVIGCYNFDEFPNAIILENPIPGDYYIRVWDALLSTTGTFVTSAHTLPIDINDWIICDDVSGEGTGYRANQLIVQPGDMFDIANYDQAFRIVDSCLCADPPLLLFEADDFDIYTDGKITAQNDPDVEGIGNNYKMEFRRLPYESSCGSSLICDPINKYKPVNPATISRIAIIDSGINTEHDAFENAHWINDDPQNPEACHLVSEIGYDFRYEQITPEDSVGHGSWVAGTITEDFPIDIQLELMSLKFFGGNDDFLFDAICAMYFAIDEGASTIVTSWGFRSAEYPEILSDVLIESDLQDVLIVSSAGNLGFDNDHPVIGKYPANAPLDNIISVTAFDDVIGIVPTYANFGATSVDLAAIDHVIAPGSVLNGTSLTVRDSVVGTSISAPRVARTAAIMKAYYPILTAEEIRICILESVTLVPALVGVVATGGALDHDAALACANTKAAFKSCVATTITVAGTLVNDVTFRTSTFIRALSVVESSAHVILEAGNQIDFKPDFEVKTGAVLEAINNDCSSFLLLREKK